MCANWQHSQGFNNFLVFPSADAHTLKKHLIDELDYNLLPEEGWFKLVSWYGVTLDQQALPKKVLEHGLFVKNLKIEVYLREVKLSQHSDPETLITREFSRGDTVGEFWHLRLQSTAVYTHRIQYLEKF